MHTRYPLALEMSYSVLDGARMGERRASQTIDLSSSGVRFIAADPLALRTRVEIAINWPTLLEGRIALQLIAAGVVVRSSGRETAVRLEEHAFKTRRTGSKLVCIR
jgi:PilZ domain